MANLTSPHFKRHALLTMALAFVLLLSGCAGEEQPTATPNPLVSPTATPSSTPTATPAPTATPLTLSNIYVDGAYCLQTAYWTQEEDPHLMLPLQAVSEMLGVIYTVDADGQINIDKGTRHVHLAPEPDKESSLSYNLNGTEKRIDRGSTELNGVLYVPYEFFEEAMNVNLSMNPEEDILITSLPDPTATPDPSADPSATTQG